MKIYLYPCLLVLLMWSCTKPAEPLEKEAVAAQQDSIPAVEKKPRSFPSVHILKVGMVADSVKAKLGEPTKIEPISTQPDVQDWWYGDNQKVRLVRGAVDQVTEDVAHEQKLLRELIKARDSGNEEEVRRLMEELTR